VKIRQLLECTARLRGRVLLVGALALCFLAAFFFAFNFHKPSEKKTVEKQATPQKQNTAVEKPPPTVVAPPAKSDAVAEVAAPPAPPVATPAKPEDTPLAPEDARRPVFVEKSLYPRDISIGELGQGALPESCYNYARSVLRMFIAGKEDKKITDALPAASVASVRKKIADINPEIVRVGSGEKTADGANSFEFRFIGKNGELVGAIYLSLVGDSWAVEDIIPEEPRKLDDSMKNDNPYLWQPYNRFY
jgi:hypothetical protein